MIDAIGQNIERGDIFFKDRELPYIATIIATIEGRPVDAAYPDRVINSVPARIRLISPKFNFRAASKKPISVSTSVLTPNWNRFGVKGTLEQLAVGTFRVPKTNLDYTMSISSELRTLYYANCSKVASYFLKLIIPVWQQAILDGKPITIDKAWVTELRTIELYKPLVPPYAT